MKKLLTLFVITAFALPAAALEAPGGVFYKMPSGELVKREGTLVHATTEKGEQKVSLVFGDKASLDAKRIHVKKSGGRSVVHMLFVTEVPANDQTPAEGEVEKEEEAKEPTKVAMVFVGSLLRGTNAAVYYGDIYSKKVKSKGLNALYDNFQDCGGEWRALLCS